MIFLLFDLITYSLTGIYLLTFIAYIPYIKLNNYIQGLLLFLILNNNYYIFIILIIFYLLNKILLKYFKLSFKYVITLYNFYYLILLNYVDSSYFINFIFVILLFIYKYNNKGEGLV